MRGRSLSGRLRGLIHIDIRRGVAAAVLLGGLFALLFLVLLPRGGGDGSVPPARLVDTPPGESADSAGIHPGRLARDFEASDLEGQRVRLSDLRGRPLVINFWATWCTSCLSEMPGLERQRHAHLADGLAVVAVNVGEGAGDAREFIESLELFEFAVAMDPDLTISDAYGVRGLPHSLFVDARGVIQAEYRGQLDDETMDRYVQAAIDAVRGGEAPTQLRIVTTVPREHVLEVFPDEEDPGRVRFVSRRFRCDDAYCVEPALDELRAAAGVSAFELRDEQMPPSLLVAFDPAAVSVEDIVAIVAEALRAHPDPLYTRELEVRYPDGEG